ncbi:hypothetical protein DY000_02032001 [Brassica cretica]|uniref:Uncharacterized protein n=1 Tax=Brassica cretica TaxID=69181 RepID=A0ABQ7DZ04_BRACR|nr:hypothetical protein DY000_02032001 [Brassica cretica]
MGEISVEFLSASLLYHFQWELAERMVVEDVDMEEAPGLTVSKKTRHVVKTIYKRKQSAILTLCYSPFILFVYVFHGGSFRITIFFRRNHEGTDVQTNEEVAIKLESVKTAQHQDI